MVALYLSDCLLDIKPLFGKKFSHFFFLLSRNDFVLPSLLAQFKREGKLSPYRKEINSLLVLIDNKLKDAKTFKDVVPFLSFTDFNDGVAEVMTYS